MRASLTAPAIGLLLIATAAASGCGLKGDLYLPQEPPATADPAADETGSDDDSSDRAPHPDDLAGAAADA